MSVAEELNERLCNIYNGRARLLPTWGFDGTCCVCALPDYKRHEDVLCRIAALIKLELRLMWRGHVSSIVKNPYHIELLTCTDIDEQRMKRKFDETHFSIISCPTGVYTRFCQIIRNEYDR